MSARVDELRRLVAEAETNAGVEALIAAARDMIIAYDDRCKDPYDIEIRLRMAGVIDRLMALVGNPGIDFACICTRTYRHPECPSHGQVGRP